jgi:hypothetical protein
MSKRPSPTLIFVTFASLTIAVTLSIQVLAGANSSQQQQQGQQPPPPISGGGQSTGGSGVTQGTPDAAPPPNPDFGSVQSCKFGKMDLAHDQQGLQNQAQSLRAKVAGDQEALRRLKLQNRASAFEDESKLAACAKADLQRQNIGALISGVKNSVPDMGPGNRVLSPSMAKQVIQKMEAAHLNNPDLFAYIRGLAGTTEGKQAIWDLLDKVQKSNDMLGIRGNIDETQGKGDSCSATTLEPWLDGGGTLLGWVKLPNLEAVKGYVDVARFIVFGGIDASTYYLGNQNVEALNSLTEQDLKVANMWKDKLVSDVGCLKETQAALTKPNTPKGGMSSGTKAALVVLVVGGAAGGAAAAVLASQNKTSSSQGQCDGTSSVNPCGPCTSNAQCGNGGCFTTVHPAPFCQ